MLQPNKKDKSIVSQTIEKYGEWVPAAELADTLGISQSSIYSALRRRGLHPYKIAKAQRRKIALDEIEEQEYIMRERISKEM